MVFSRDLGSLVEILGIDLSLTILGFNFVLYKSWRVIQYSLRVFCEFLLRVSGGRHRQAQADWLSCVALPAPCWEPFPLEGSIHPLTLSSWRIHPLGSGYQFLYGWVCHLILQRWPWKENLFAQETFPSHPCFLPSQSGNLHVIEMLLERLWFIFVSYYYYYIIIFAKYRS